MARGKSIVTILKLDGKNLKIGSKEARDDLLKISAASLGVAAAFGIAAAATASYQDATIKAARIAGTTAEEFSALQLAAEQTGVSTDLLTKGMVLLANPTEQMTKVMKQLGINTKDVNGEQKKSAVLLKEVAAKTKAMIDPAQKAAVGFKLFGEEGARLTNLLALGADGIEEITDKARALGIVVTEEAGIAAEKFNDNLNNLGKSLKGVTNAIGSSVIAFVNQSGIMESITETITSLTDKWNSLDEGTKEIILTIASAAAGVVALGGAMAVVIKVLPILRAGFASLLGPVGLIFAAITTIVTILVLQRTETEKLISTINRSNKVLDRNIAIVTKLSKVQKRTKDETRALASSTQALADQALLAGRAVEFENANLVEKIRISKEIRAENIKQLKDQLKTAEVLRGATLNIVKFRRATKASNITLDELSTAMQGLSSAMGLSLDFAFDRAGQVALTRLSNASKQVNLLKKALEELPPVGRTINQRPINLGATAARTRVVALTDFLLTDLSKAIKKVNADADKFIASSKAVTTDILKQQIEIADAQKKREQLINKLIADRKKVIADVFKTELDLQIESIKSRIANAKEAARQLLSVGEKLNDEFARLDKKQAKQIANARIKAFANTVFEIADNVGILTDAFSQLTDTFAAESARTLAIAARDSEVEVALFKRRQEKLIKELEDGAADQIAALEDAEATKLAIAEGAANERLLILNKEFQAAKLLEEQRLKDQIANAARSLEVTKEEFTQRAIDKEQLLFAESVIDEDFKKLIENLERESKKNLANIGKEFRENEKTAEAERKANTESTAITTAEAIAQIEADKAMKLAAIQEGITAKEKSEAQKITRQQWEAEKAQFEITKGISIAQTTASGIAAAAQAFAALAPIPFVGSILGIAAAGAIIAATTASVAQIAGQSPIKPSSLFLQEGALVPGNVSHERGGVSANLESGELVVDRARTQRILNAVERGTTGQGGIQIIFQPGSIQGVVDSEDAAQRMADMLAQMLRRQGIQA